MFFEPGHQIRPTVLQIERADNDTGSLVKTLAYVGIASLFGLPGAVLAQEGPRLNKLIELFENDQPAFGVLSLDHSLNNARAIANPGLDFVFIDMEHALFDVERLRLFLLRIFVTIM